MKTIDRTLLWTRIAANEQQATTIWSDPGFWYQGSWAQGWWGTLWDTYFNTAGKQGEKPPADVQKLYDLLAKINTEKPEDAMAAVDAIKTELKAHTWYFNYLPNVKQPVIVNAKIGNMPDKGFAYSISHSIEQFFFKK